MKDQQTNNIDKNKNVGTQDEPLTTEGFHALLEANTAKLSEQRTAYATAISGLQQSYDDAMDIILKKEHQANAELRKAREEFEKAKEEHELFLRQLKRERNEVGESTTRTRLKPRTAGLPPTRRFRASVTTSSSATAIRVGCSREPRKDYCTQAGPRTRKEE